MSETPENKIYRITFSHRHGSDTIDVSLPDWPSDEEVGAYLGAEHGYDAEDPEDQFDVDLASKIIAEQEFRDVVKKAGAAKKQR